MSIILNEGGMILVDTFSDIGELLKSSFEELDMEDRVARILMGRSKVSDGQLLLCRDTELVYMYSEDKEVWIGVMR